MVRGGQGRGARMEILTIGHSSRSQPELLELLAGPGVRELVDVRRYPGSRKFPHFRRDSLQAALEAAGVGYTWIEALGGRREASEDPADSPNGGLRNPDLRHYADYMRTGPFREAVAQLLEISERGRPAILCAERDPARCHRRLIADHLVATGALVLHIIDGGSLREHTLTAGARARDDGVIYPAPPGEPEGEQTLLFPEEGE